LVEWFAETYGLIGPKSDSLCWPEDLPPELYVHFMRGLWDSDGSLSIHGRHPPFGNAEAKCRFSSNTESFVRRVYAELLAVGLFGGGVGADMKQWRVSYSSSPATQVARYLYKDSPVHLRNEDRYAVYERMEELRDFVELPCSCGQPASMEGLCKTCWWDRKGRMTGAGVACAACGKPKVLAKGLCSGCYSRIRRADQKAVT